MSTIKQEKALEKMVENGGNVGKAMIEVGYSINTAKTPQKLTESKGFIELCDEKGLTDSLLIDSLIEDIKDKKGHRKAELELAFKIKGRFVEGKFEPNEQKISGGVIILPSKNINIELNPTNTLQELIN